MVKFWIYDISVLANKNHLLEIWPYQYLSMERKFNSISRLIIYLTILGYFYSKRLNILIAGVITLLVFVTLYHVQQKNNKEGFDGKNKQGGQFNRNSKASNDFKNIMKEKFSLPTRKNPLMNVMLDDYKYNNKKKAAAPSYNRAIKKNIDRTSKYPLLSNSLTDNKSVEFQTENKLFSGISISYLKYS